jgi:DNA-binding response OmpR family regulator
MASLLLLTDSLQSSGEVLPAIGLLQHQVRVLPAQATLLIDAPECDVVLVDGRHDLASTRSLCRLIRTTGIDVPLLLIMAEGGLAAVTVEWCVDDVIVVTAGPAEVEARLRLAIGRLASDALGEPDAQVIRGGGVEVDEASYTATIEGDQLDLTFKEFELLKYLAQHPGRVFTRQQLLQEVWGYDYFGGSRTVDVHIRRLRAKLGPEHDHLIGTVRNVGYRFVLPRDNAADASAATPTTTQPGQASSSTQSPATLRARR